MRLCDKVLHKEGLCLGDPNPNTTEEQKELAKVLWNILAGRTEVGDQKYFD